jgi:hypothetical protein
MQDRQDVITVLALRFGRIDFDAEIEVKQLVRLRSRSVVKRRQEWHVATIARRHRSSSVWSPA